MQFKDPRLLSCQLALSIMFLGVLSLANAFAQEHSVQTLRVPQSNAQDINNDDYYFRQLLVLALNKAKATHEVVHLKELSIWLADNRLHHTLAQDRVDIIWSVTSAKAEQELLPIKVPLLRDLDDYRVLLIRKNEQSRFNDINKVEDLGQFVGGMSAQWPDADVMRHNKLPMVTAIGYGKLFKMLAAGRFDYFSRGLYQAQAEVSFYPELELEIEQRLLLHYPNAYYYFVNKKKVALAQKIEKGLNIALEDGSFDTLFNSIPRYRWAQKELQSGKRKVINLALPE